MRKMKSTMKSINRYKKYPKIDFNKWLGKRMFSSEVGYFTTVLGGYLKIGEYEPAKFNSNGKLIN